MIVPELLTARVWCAKSQYFLPSQWVPVLSPTPTVQTADNTVTKSGRNLSDTLKSIFKIVAVQLRSVKIAPKSLFLHVNRSPIRYSVRVCARAVRYRTYRKIPKVSPGAYIFQRPFLRDLFLEGLIYGGAYLRRDICVSKSIGLAL